LIAIINIRWKIFHLLRHDDKKVETFDFEHLNLNILPYLSLTSISDETIQQKSSLPKPVISCQYLNRWQKRLIYRYHIWLMSGQAPVLW